MSNLSFKDSSGREWSCRLSFPAAKAIQANCDINLDNADAVGKAFTDPITVVLMIAEACREQWQLANVERVVKREPSPTDRRTTETVIEPMTLNDFIEVVLESPETSAAAAGAIQRGLADWYARLGRPAFGKLLEATAEAQRRADQKALEKVSDSRVGGILDKVVNNAIDKIDKAIELAERQASTP